MRRSSTAFPKADRKLEDGDIISIDVGVKVDGWCSDSAWTFPVGEIDESTRLLMEVTEDALDRAVSAAVVEGSVGDIGAAVVTRVKGTSLGIIRDLVGHGVGAKCMKNLRFRTLAFLVRDRPFGRAWCWRSSRCCPAERRKSRRSDDRWTVVTRDRTRSAHFEHTVAVTSVGPRILTAAPAEAPA